MASSISRLTKGSGLTSPRQVLSNPVCRDFRTSSRLLRLAVILRCIPYAPERTRSRWDAAVCSHQPLSFHSSPQTFVDSVKKPRICHIKNLIHDAIDPLREFGARRLFWCPNTRMHIIPQFPKFMDEASECGSLAPRNTFLRKPKKFIGDTDEFEIFELQSFVSFRAKLLALVDGCLLHVFRKQKAHRL